MYFKYGFLESSTKSFHEKKVMIKRLPKTLNETKHCTVVNIFYTVEIHNF